MRRILIRYSSLAIVAALGLAITGRISVSAQAAPARRVIVHGDSQVSGRLDETPAELAKLGVRVLRLPAETAAQVASTPGFIQWEQPVWALETIPDDPGWGQQYGPASIQAPLAWDVTTGTVTVTIAIVDTGIDLGHPDFAGKLVTGTTFITTTTSPQDDNGHGTHVAGIAAATGNNALGIAGVNWGARLMPIKVLDSQGNGDDLDVAAGIVWAADHGAKVVNLSLGGECPSPIMDLAVTYAYTSGVTVVAAAGNTGRAGVLCPAAYEPAIAAAATGPSNLQAAFSTYGPEVDLAAPGVGIYSTMPGGGYGYKSGTSMAAPHIAGAAALLASLPRFNTPAIIRTALEATALDLGLTCRDFLYGAGLVQAYTAAQFQPGAPVRTCDTWRVFFPVFLNDWP
jgi:thermitase